MSSIKDKTITGIVWSTLERFSVQGIQFVIQIVMARMLMPEDYGIIAMLAIFLAVFQSFVDSGFSSALVQKKDRSELDYSTVFYFNLGISIVLFIILFLSAPLIAVFYKTPALISVTKVVAINLLINAFGVVPRARLTVQINFKAQAKASLIAVIISGSIGIWMAYTGYGVWALVFQSLLNYGINTLLLWILSKWLPKRMFSISSFKNLFSFGSKLLLSGLLETIYRNLYTLVIGKKYNAQELGYYSRAEQFALFLSANLSGVIGRVIFPVMCEVQHDDVYLKKIFSKSLRISIFVISPLMIGLAALSDPFIRIILTEKWLATVVLLRIMCFVYVLYPIHALNLILLQVKGRSDLFLKLEIIKKMVGLVVLIITIPFGITMMCTGMIMTSVLCLYINAFYTKKYFCISIFHQARDILPSFLLSGSMGTLVFFITRLKLPYLYTLLLGVCIGCSYYIGVAAIFKMREWNDLWEIFKNISARRKCFEISCL